jgi:catechol 2,3-dioxygenase-like lactoylglutathione lyase family enzyme
MAGDFTVRINPEVAPPGYMIGLVEGSGYLAKFPAEAITQSAAASAPVALPFSPNIRRLTLVVANIERALGFYRDGLGFTVGSIRPLDDKGSGKTLFGISAAAKSRFVTLDAGLAQREALGLVENPSYRAKAAKGGRDAALVVKLPVSLDLVVPQLKSSGATVLAPSYAGTNREQAVLDPDGHLVILYELAR